MNYKRGDFVVFSRGTFYAYTGLNSIHIGCATSSVRVRCDANSICRPENVFGVYSTKKEAQKSLPAFEKVWSEYNELLRDKQKEVKGLVAAQIDGTRHV